MPCFVATNLAPKTEVFIAIAACFLEIQSRSKPYYRRLEARARMPGAFLSCVVAIAEHVNIKIFA
jgi:hypothetical protein